MIKSRDQWVASIRDVSLLPHTPIKQKNGQWAVTQRMKVWEAVGPRIFDDYLDRFLKVAVGVLSERDPQFELDSDLRYAARIRDKVLKHSEQLRSGIAETLALLGSFPQYLTSCSREKPTITALLAVRKILTDADWVTWASANQHLPMLAEASPEEFLEAVEKACRQPISPFADLFAQESSGAMGRNYMTGLLWGLETLAWHPDYLIRVIVLLGNLAEMDPGGNWRNRPANSITEILLPWHPQTCADFLKCKIAVATLLKENPEIGWKALLSLLPKTHGSASGTRKPKWRPLIPSNWTDDVTKGQYWDRVNGYAQLAVTTAENDLPKLKDLIEYLPKLTPSARTQLLSFVTSINITRLPESERYPLWDSLMRLAARHRRSAHTNWAMSSDAITEIEQIASKLAPDSGYLLYRRLFNTNDAELFERNVDYEKSRAILIKKREHAVGEVYGVSGIDGVAQLSLSTAASWKVGIALGSVANSALDAKILPDYLCIPDTKLERMAAAFVWGRFFLTGWSWVDSIISSSWSYSQKAAFLSYLPFNRQTWDRAKQFLAPHESKYWELADAAPREADEVDVPYAVERFLNIGRTLAAIECLGYLAREGKTISPDLVFRALQENITSQKEIGEFDQHTMIELIEWLQERPDLDAMKLASLEWNYLPILDGFTGGSPKTLTKRLSEDPVFFCEVIRSVYRSKSEEPTKDSLPLEREKVAENAYKLLHEWRTPPGCDELGRFEESAFNKWFYSMKNLSKESGHFEVAMSQTGQVLPYAPPDPSGLWIHKIVADELNSPDAEALRSGFTCELFNMRGTHGFTGGQEERKIAGQLRAKAEAVEAEGYHRLATSIRDLASSYERDAERDAGREPGKGDFD